MSHARMLPEPCPRATFSAIVVRRVVALALTRARWIDRFALGRDEMYGFTDDDLVARAPSVTLWRADKVILVHIQGILDDAVSDRWRAMVTDEIAKRGVPRFVALDFSQGDPQNSMAARYRSAAFAREMMKRIEHGMILTGGTAGPTVVIRALLRTVGLPNLELLVDVGEFAEGIAAMRRGFRPRRVSPQRAS